MVGKRNIIWRNSGASEGDTTLVRSPQANLSLTGWETSLLGLWCLSDWLLLSKLWRDCCTTLFTYRCYAHVYRGDILFRLPMLLPSSSHNTLGIEFVIIRLADSVESEKKSSKKSRNILQAMKKRFEELSTTQSREHLSSHQTEWVLIVGTPSSEEHWTDPANVWFFRFLFSVL